MAGAPNLFISILEFVLALGFLAFIHEAGHFLVSRLFKIEVEEFGFGFPPRLAKLFTLGGTLFTLNWIPFGAFVRPKGENDPNVPGGLGAASPWKRLLVLLGGPAANILTGIILFLFVFIQTGAPDSSKVLIASVVADSPAAQSGIQAGDLILKVNGQPVTSMDNMSALIKTSVGKDTVITYQRNGQIGELTVVPRPNPPSGQGPLGVQLTNPMVPITLGQAIPMSLQVTGNYINQLFLLPSRIIQGQLTPEQSRVVGPFGMFTMFNQERNRDIQTTSTPAAGPAVNVLSFLAIISVALGITNLLPIPALDGGRILFLIPEILFHKRVPPKYENAVHAIGFFALVALLVVITAQDIINPVVLP
ncbi:MAG TPA: M50 family metallopeptidase [Anaerolineaceae bacterium]|nr:M50 family metallopeptidase [Anaerolineaceae bacterium]